MKLRPLLLIGALLLIAPASAAQSVSDASRRGAVAAEMARKKGHEGLEHFAAGRFAEAIAAFDEAEQLTHSPVFLLYRARSLKELGQFLESRDAYEACAGESLGDDAPAAWERAVVEARREMRQLGLLIPKLSLRIEGGPSWPVEITWQGRRVVLNEAESSQPTALLEGNPGLWEIHLTAQDGTKLVLLHAAPAAKTSDVLVAHFPVQSSSPLRDPGIAPPPPRDQTRLPARTWGAIAAFSCSGVSLAVGSVAGTMALAKARSIREGCIGSSCLPEDERRADGARQLAQLATAGFVVSAVGATAGLGLLFIPGGRQGDDRTMQTLPRIQLRASISGLDLTGRF